MRPMALGDVAIPPVDPLPTGALCPCLYFRRMPMRYAGLLRMFTLVSEIAAWYSFKAASAFKISKRASEQRQAAAKRRRGVVGAKLS